MSMSGDYPAAERLDLTEEMHGHLVADPYRWLEDSGDPRTGQWSAEQLWLDQLGFFAGQLGLEPGGGR